MVRCERGLKSVSNELHSMRTNLSTHVNIKTGKTDKQSLKTGKYCSDTPTWTTEEKSRLIQKIKETNHNYF